MTEQQGSYTGYFLWHRSGSSNVYDITLYSGIGFIRFDTVATTEALFGKDWFTFKIIDYEVYIVSDKL